MALDVARLLMRPPEELKATDITQYAYEKLLKNSIRTVRLIGRRGPVQSAWTTKELRELLTLPNCQTLIKKSDLQLNEASQQEIANDRPKKRMLELLASKATLVDDTLSLPINSQVKTTVIDYYCSPIEFKGDNHTLTALKVEHNILQGLPNQQCAVGNHQFTLLPCDIAFKSIGYQSLPMEGVPFRQGIIPNQLGRVLCSPQPHLCNHIYVCGWVKRGPSGIIGTNKWDAEETVTTLLHDMQQEEISSLDGSLGREPVLHSLSQRSIHPVFWQDWRKIDKEEEERGSTAGKSREKITSTGEMLQIIAASK